MSEYNVSGFASFVGGKVISSDTNCPLVANSDCFVADYHNVGIYDKDITFSPESTIGFQISVSSLFIDNPINVIVQTIARGTEEWETSLDWAFIEYELSPTWQIRFGRERIPLGYYSDFYEIGYSYPWVRPPSEVYFWQFSKLDGIKIIHENFFKDWNYRASLYFGEENDEANKFFSELSRFVFFETLDYQFKNIVGLTFESNKNWLDMRAAMMTGELDITQNRLKLGAFVLNDTTVFSTRDVTYGGLSINVDLNNFILLSEAGRLQSEINLRTINTDTYMVSVAYRWNNLTPYILFSSLDSIDEITLQPDKFSTISLGIRWDLSYATAFKFQIDRTNDDSEALISTTTVQDSPRFGNATLVSIGIDTIF